MRNQFFAIALVAAPMGVAVAQSPVATPADPRSTPIAQNGPEVARKVNEHLQRLVPFGFSGAILLAKDGKILLSRGYGMADRENAIPVTESTVFDIGSITKQFTAAAILKLEMEGRLSVNDSLGRWFQNVPADKRGITIHHLLTHTSGLRDIFGGDYEVAERDSLMGVILNSRLNAPPPAPYDYSNAGYTVLAVIVEKASGMPYEDYLRTRILTPAGLTRTGYRGVTYQPRELAVGYRAGQRWGTPLDKLWASDGPYWNLRGNGGILSTLPELYRWHVALGGDSILSADAKRKMWTAHTAENPGGSSSYGYGWSVAHTTRGTQLIAHNGGNGIFYADFRRYTDEGVVFLIASSTADASASQIQQQLLRLIFGGEYGEPPVVASGSTRPAPALSGAYRLSPASTINVEIAGDRLRLMGSGQDAFALLRGVPNQPRFDTLSRSAVRALEAAERGDAATFRAAFDTPQRADEFVRLHQEFSRNISARLGAFQGVDAVGTAERGPRTVSTLRMRYERGEQYVNVTWAGDRIVDINVVRYVPHLELLPASANEWVAYDFASGRTLRVRFEGGGLTLHTPSGPVRAAKI